MTDAAFSNEGPNDSQGQYNQVSFIVQSILANVQTASLVKVIACSNDGGLSPVGTVDVKVLTNIQTAVGVAIPHGVIYGLPYFRIQGGINAIILDPQPGDIGAAVFCSRDISSVVAAKAQANPDSKRLFDWSDGLYFGGMLNGVPQQYVQFNDDGITLVSPTKVTIQAPAIDIDGGGETTIDGKVFLLHTHTGVQTGGGTSGPVGP